MSFTFVMTGLLLIAAGIFSFAVAPMQQDAALVGAVLFVGGFILLGFAWLAAGVAALREEAAGLRREMLRRFGAS